MAIWKIFFGTEHVVDMEADEVEFSASHGTGSYILWKNKDAVCVVAAAAGAAVVRTDLIKEPAQ